MITRLFPLWTKIKAIRQHGRMLWEAFKHPMTPKWIKGIMIATGVYLLSPIDLVPDFALILGLTDDAVVITVVMWALGHLIPAHVQSEIAEKLAPKRETGKWTDRAAEKSEFRSNQSQNAGLTRSGHGEAKNAATNQSTNRAPWYWLFLILAVLGSATWGVQTGLISF